MLFSTLTILSTIASWCLEHLSNFLLKAFRFVLDLQYVLPSFVSSGFSSFSASSYWHYRAMLKSFERSHDRFLADGLWFFLFSCFAYVFWLYFCQVSILCCLLACALYLLTTWPLWLPVMLKFTAADFRPHRLLCIFFFCWMFLSKFKLATAVWANLV